jgi:hypothetical protein
VYPPAVIGRHDQEDNMTSDRLLSEIERQQKYLDRLPDDFTFPLFNARQALESQRASAYGSTAAASREIVDNALEAGASEVHLVFEEGRSGKRPIVTSIAFIDDGAGMLSKMARFALSWGGGTHFDEPEFIGKFGFGLPNASINQTKRVEVYTRVSDSQPFAVATLDIDTFAEHGVQSIPEPKEGDLPDFVAGYVKRNQLDLSHGTVVVWNQPDRLTYKSPGYLKEHLVDDFGVTYRYMLGEPGRRNGRLGARIVVAGQSVEPVDPLFLTPGARLYRSPDEGGAILSEERFLPVVYHEDPERGERHLRLVDDESQLPDEDPYRLAVGTIHVRIGRFPIGFAQDRGRRTREPADDGQNDAWARFEIRKARRGMSFVRVGREIQTIESFPRSARDIANGLGRWPLLQGYAYHWGCEVRFGPEFDEVMGITNDKQGVRPIEDLWRVFHQAEIDQALVRENRWQSEQRRKKPAAPSARPGQATAAEMAARDADAAAGTGPRVPERARAQARERFEQAALERANHDQRLLDEARAALEEEAKRRPYQIQYFEAEYGPIYVPDWLGGRVLVRVNTSHPFYEVLYGQLLDLSGAAQAKEALDLFLIALAKAELTAEDEQMALWYETQRRDVWSRFLQTAMTALANRMNSREEEDDIDAAVANGDGVPSDSKGEGEAEGTVITT